MSTVIESKKLVFRHPRNSTKILKQWYAAHSSSPYPTDEDKEFLSNCTGLSGRQVSQWFVNARRRRETPLKNNLPAPTQHVLPTTSQSLPSNLAHSGGEWNEMTPLDRWRLSPPEEEPAPLHAISSAVEHGIGAHPESMPDLRFPDCQASDSVSSFNFSSAESSLDSFVNSDSSGPCSSPRTAFEDMTVKLGDYVRAAAANGIVVTDELLRDEARRIFYGDDDPWNFTPADNDQWLEMFKMGYGLASSTSLDNLPAATGQVTQTFQGNIGPELIAQPSIVGLTPFTPENMQLKMTPPPTGHPINRPPIFKAIATTTLQFKQQYLNNHLIN
ncbi:hypothetical protein DL764_002411 [Monosporascus ibericus]|uniref:Homeobox domain-containing protein n=1 Tax=Monosporascus ibericus TaxID=155417 RepID=A0A4Q4TKF7_9PEZI|nr:hypothetical protein DL764_002411 [Monosporascus ibericus]